MKLIRTRGDQPSNPDRPTGPRHTWKLLVVDDEPDVRELTRLIAQRGKPGMWQCRRPLRQEEARRGHKER